jgi:hypothetical protein
MKAFMIAFAAILVASLATIAGVSVSRSAPASEPVHETRALTGFHRIEIAGQATVTLIQGDSEGVSIDAPASTDVHTDVHDGKLDIEVSDRRHGWQWFGRTSGHSPKITINLRQLDRLETAGAVSVGADKLHGETLRFDLAGASSLRIGELQATTLKLDGSGATKIEIAGKVTRQDVDLSGAGSYAAAQLSSDDASVEVSGAGKAVVNARNTLAVDISGAGKVEYVGDPKLKQTISGIGKVARREGS